MNVYGLKTSALDPRAAISSDELRQASLRAAPQVPRRSRTAEGLGAAAGVFGVALVGGAALLTMDHSRVAKLQGESQPAYVAPAATPTPTPLFASRAPVTAAPAAIATAAGAQPVAPILILDQTSGSTPSASAAASPPHGPQPPNAGGKNPVYFTPDEQFAGRAGDQSVPTASASRLANLGQVVVQGTMIPAVLETAVNSDLPGYARAIVSQDVRSFDRSAVLIPRGSRLIGEYKSAASIGQVRAFIVWTRVLRPDGVSVQLGSPATDEVGRAGLTGKVDGHFFERFGGAILLTAVSGLASAAGSGSTVVLGTTTDSSGASTALQSSAKISPTIRVPQGTPIQVFVARDLDFNDVGS